MRIAFALLVGLTLSACMTNQERGQKAYAEVLAERLHEARATTPKMQARWFQSCPQALSLLQTVNKVREEEGLSALQADPALMRVAMNHASDTASRGYLDSKSPDGTTFDQRIARSGYQRWGRAENLVQEESAAKAVEMWQASRHHNNNLLLKSAYFAGVGCAKAQNGLYNWVLVLGR